MVKSVKKEYTVSFVTDCDVSVNPVTLKYGETVEEPTVKREGYRLIGWFTDSSRSTPVDWEKPITGNAVYYASWGEVVNVKALLSSLLDGYKANPYEYIPESMRPDYDKNLVNSADIITDYSSFVNVSGITTGFGEQWNMVIENIQESGVFFNVLSVVETLSSVSVTAFNNYFDKNPADTAHHSFESGIYNVTISFDGTEIFYVLDYTGDFPIIGNETAQIMLSMNVKTGERVVRVQLGDANALKYVIGENFYEFAIRYLGVRRAYFLVRENNGVIDGHIYEYLTVSGAEISSAADFYITDDYVTTVGNKADGMIGFNNYITEVYDVRSGKLLGYEVKETQSILEFNTLWFDLKSVSGINSIKYAADTENFFVNGSSAAWQSKNVSLINFSRRFDIEFRTQYVYEYDEDSGEYAKIKISVPMFFVQEEHYSTLAKDVKEVNAGVDVAVTLSAANLNKIKNDYYTYVEVFIANKELVTVDKILEFIGEKKEF